MVCSCFNPKDLFGVGDITDSRVLSMIGLRTPLLICCFKKPCWDISADYSDADSVKKEFSDSS